MLSQSRWHTPQEVAKQLETDVLMLLAKTRHIEVDELDLTKDSIQESTNGASIPAILRHHAATLRHRGQELEGIALEEVSERVARSASFGGMGLEPGAIPTEPQYAEVLFLVEAYFESINSQARSRDFLCVQEGLPEHTKPMTLAQKIFTQHALVGHSSSSSGLAVGDVIRSGVDYIIASELSWKNMEQTYSELGNPGIWRNDRFWIAGDHVVHPSLSENPKIKAYIETAEKAKRDFKLTEYQGMNYTIMHTEFVRERAEPGMLVVGSDSHTCSAGAVGCLSIGLGGADVMMTLVLGETWFKVPESILIEFVGQPSVAISGKDVILHILKELKRNTVAAERIVEFAGEGVKYLSIDARFAICNMCTEFGAITGVFVPDAITLNYIGRRKRKANRCSSLYFQPDPGAVYVEQCTIDLSAVEPSIAIHPEPDDVVPVSQRAGMHLDGVFIGACTTTEEELVLAALVLKVGLRKKLPVAKGKRHYVPGSLPIVERLRELELLQVYESAGFTRGPPGCSLCVGLSAEKASEGETWLSSQNRNFENRMGKGSFGHLSSAIVCAASSFSMTITDPASFVGELDLEFFERYKGTSSVDLPQVMYAGPRSYRVSKTPSSADAIIPETEIGHSVIESKIVTLGDFIDTDALSPGFTLTTCTTEEEFGQHVLCHTHPGFRGKVAEGQQIVVAGHAFGVGSSRETAVSALKGAGVKAVIAKSFAFIFGRNSPSLGLLAIVMDDDDFYAAAQDEEHIVIDLPRRSIAVSGREFPFQLSEIEFRLTQNRGIAQAYNKFGNSIWEKLMEEEESGPGSHSGKANPRSIDDRLTW